MATGQETQLLGRLAEDYTKEKSIASGNLHYGGSGDVS